MPVLRRKNQASEPAESLDTVDPDQQIFVQIPSYRDPELPLTIADALEKADAPERLTFGICWQYDEYTAGDLEQWLEDDRFRIDEVYYRRSKGCCWARSRINELYRGEAYTLQIDAHSRFGDGWDRRFVEMLESIDAPKPLLTTYPPGYVKTDDGGDELNHEVGVQRLKLERHFPDLTTRQKGEMAPDLSGPGPSFFIAAGLIFTRGRFCVDVPYDPDLYFAGEEISLAVRAYTSGYDFFYPHENLVWHLYDHSAPLHWSDNPDHHMAHARAIDRLHTLLVGDASGLGRFGLGTERTVADYEAYSGLDFARRLEDRVPEPTHLKLDLKLDTSEIEPRDDWELWVFALFNEDEIEIHRDDIYDPDVLSGKRRKVKLDVELYDRPTRYILWPKSHGGDWGPRLEFDLPSS